MSLTKKMISFGFLLCLSIGRAYSQSGTQNICGRTEKNIQIFLPQSKTVSRNFFSNSCSFEFLLQDSGVDLNIDIYDSTDNASKAIDATITGVEILEKYNRMAPMPFDLRKARRFWDQIWFKKPGLASSGFIYARKQNVVVHLLSAQRESLLRFEHTIRSHWTGEAKKKTGKK